MNLTTPTLIALAMILASPASAQTNDIEYEFRLGAGRTDNVARTPSDEIEETVGVAGLRLDWGYQSAGVAANVFGDVEFRHYADETFDDDTFGAANADLRLGGSTFSWVFDNRFGHVLRDPFQPETPRNRERINTFSTGPDLRIAFGAASALQLFGRWGSNTFSESNADNQNISGGLAFVQALSRNRNLSLNVVANRVEFDDEIENSSFDTQAAFLGFSSENSRGTISIDLGYNELHDNGEVRDGNYVEAVLDRSLTQRTTLTFSYEQRLSYAGNMFRTAQSRGVSFGETRDVSGVADPLEIKRLRASLSYRRAATNMSLSFLAQDSEFLTDNGLDRSSYALRASIDREFAGAWEVLFDAGFRRGEFEASPREDDDLTLRLGINRRFGNRLRLQLDFVHRDRDSNDNGAIYTENTVFLTFRFGR